MGEQGRLVINDEILQTIHLEQDARGGIDVAPLLALGAQNHPEEAQKYIVYGDMLERLKRK